MATGVTLITGTSSGIGLATAVAAAGRGMAVVATMRDPNKAPELRKAADEAGVELDIRQLDVTDPRSVTGCVEAVVADYGRLDAVVNNAGAGHVGTIEQETLDAVRAVMEVNFFGVVAVTRAAMAHLRKTGGRLVTVTSVGGVVGQPFNEAYCAAKFAVEGFMESLAPVAARVGVTVCIVEPGAVRTEFVANTGVDPAALIAAAGPYADSLRAYAQRTLGSAYAAAQTAQEVAVSVIEALTAATPPPRVQTSGWARDFVAVKLRDTDGSDVQELTGSWLT